MMFGWWYLDGCLMDVVCCLMDVWWIFGSLDVWSDETHKFHVFILKDPTLRRRSRGNRPMANAAWQLDSRQLRVPLSRGNRGTCLVLPFLNRQRSTVQATFVIFTNPINPINQSDSLNVLGQVSLVSQKHNAHDTRVSKPWRWQRWHHAVPVHKIPSRRSRKIHGFFPEPGETRRNQKIPSRFSKEKSSFFKKTTKKHVQIIVLKLVIWDLRKKLCLVVRENLHWVLAWSAETSCPSRPEEWPNGPREKSWMPNLLSSHEGVSRSDKNPP